MTTRRGGRVLQDDIQVALLTYFVAKNRPLRELTTEPPEDADELASLVAEWKLYAEAATCDAPDIHIVAEWIKKADGGARRAERGVRCVRARCVRAYGGARARCPPTALRPLGDEPLSRDCIGCVEAVVRSCV